MQIPTQTKHTHPLVKVRSVAHEGRVVDEVKARPVLWHVALEKQLLAQLYVQTWLKHPGVPQTVDHDDHVVVELAESLPADVKGLLKNRKERNTNKAATDVHSLAKMK